MQLKNLNLVKNLATMRQNLQKLEHTAVPDPDDERRARPHALLRQVVREVMKEKIEEDPHRGPLRTTTTTDEAIEEDPHRGPLHHLHDETHHRNDPRADLLRGLPEGIVMIEGIVTSKGVARDSSPEAEAAAHTTARMAADSIHQQSPRDSTTGIPPDWSTSTLTRCH